MTTDDAERIVLSLTPGRVLTDADCEAVRRVYAHRDELRSLAGSLSDRVHRQSELLSKKAEKVARIVSSGSGV